VRLDRAKDTTVRTENPPCPSTILFVTACFLPVAFARALKCADVVARRLRNSARTSSFGYSCAQRVIRARCYKTLGGARCNRDLRHRQTKPHRVKRRPQNGSSCEDCVRLARGASGDGLARQPRSPQQRDVTVTYDHQKDSMSAGDLLRSVSAALGAKEIEARPIFAGQVSMLRQRVGEEPKAVKRAVAVTPSIRVLRIQNRLNCPNFRGSGRPLRHAFSDHRPAVERYQNVCAGCHTLSRPARRFETAPSS